MTSANWQTNANLVFGTIDKALLTISNVALSIILLTICWTVWCRYVLGSPVVWYEDITSLGFAWFIFMSMAAVHNRRGHVGIDVFTSMLPQRAQMALEQLSDLFMTVFCSYVSYLCILQVIATPARSTILYIPFSYMFSSLALGFAVMAIRSASYVFGVPPLPTEE